MGASVRRLMSVMLALCVSLYALEMVVADAYASGGGAPEQDPPQMVAAQLLGPGSTTLPDGGIPPQPGIPPHTCHCTHTHLIDLIPVQTATLFPGPLRNNSPDVGEHSPASRAQEPQSRPPIA